MIFLSNFKFSERVGISVLFEKLVFHFKPSEVSFSGIMCLGLLEIQTLPLEALSPVGTTFATFFTPI